MTYTVDWSQEALAALATIWLRSSNRQVVTAAQARIDRLLAADPLGNGTLRSEGLYFLESTPCGCSSRFPPQTGLSRSLLFMSWLDYCKCGRAIIQGTSDEDKARTLHAKYVEH